MPSSDGKIRLNKAIADSGLCSRRKADAWITEGRVTLNGKVTTVLGTTLNPERDVVQVDGNRLPTVRHVYLAFHKPVGLITTRHDPEGRRTIYDALPAMAQTCDPIGRLDRASSGLILLSNNGDFVQQVMHPGKGVPKVYRVTLNRTLDEALLKALRRGVLLLPEAVTAKVASVEAVDKRTLVMTLQTGYNRQIRRMLESLGYAATKLKRVRIGSVNLGSLKPGAVRRLTQAEWKSFQQRRPERGKPVRKH